MYGSQTLRFVLVRQIDTCDIGFEYTSSDFHTACHTRLQALAPQSLGQSICAADYRELWI